MNNSENFIPKEVIPQLPIMFHKMRKISSKTLKYAHFVRSDFHQTNKYLVTPVSKPISKIITIYEKK